MITWKSSFNRLNEEYGIAKKKKHALDSLFEKGKISQSTHDSFNSEIVAAIAEIEKQQQDLAQRMQQKTLELQNQIKTLEILLTNYEIQYVAGEIDDNTYQLEINLLGSGLDTAKRELSTVQDAVNQLCAPSAPEPAIAAPAAPVLEAAPEISIAAPEPVIEEAIAAPVVEETPMIEQPIAAAEIAEAPAEPTPVIEEAPIEQPAEMIAEAPAMEEPVMEAAPVVEETPVVEEAVVEQPVEVSADEQIVEAPVVEESAEVAPVIEEAAIEQPIEAIIEAPIAEEPVVEEPVAEAPVVEEPAVEVSPVVEEAVVEQPVEVSADEPVIEAAAAQEIATPELVADAVEEAPEEMAPLDSFEVEASDVVQRDLTQIVEEIIPENPREALVAAQEDVTVETPQEACEETQQMPLHCAKENLPEAYSDSENKE